MKPIRVLLVDDHDLVRAGIRSLLSNFEGVEVVGEAGEGRDALRLIEKLQPDLVLMDIMMPGLNGLEATAQAVRTNPNVRIVFLSMNATEEYVLQAMRTGAAGYILKNVSPQELELAIRAVARGETYLSSAISRHVISGYVNRMGANAGAFERLTSRQREVLQLVGEGHTTKEIARKLKLSPKTVEMHRTQLMKTLDVHDIAGLVRYSIRMGIVSPDQ